jgi:hypothetical protein
LLFRLGVLICQGLFVLFQVTGCSSNGDSSRKITNCSSIENCHLTT